MNFLFMKNLLEKDINKRISIQDALNHYWIKGATILLDEKEKCFNQSSFISYPSLHLLHPLRSAGPWRKPHHCRARR